MLYVERSTRAKPPKDMAEQEEDPEKQWLQDVHAKRKDKTVFSLSYEKGLSQNCLHFL